jgi:hypothetical protein
MPHSPVVSSFMSRFHREHMKPRGYAKQRHVFSRPLDGYVERVRLQGSRWNHDERPWRFTVEIGVAFDGLPSADLGFPGTHLHALLEEIVPDASGDYSLRHRPSGDLASIVMDRLVPARQQVRLENEDVLMTEIAGHLEVASSRIHQWRAELKLRAQSKDAWDRQLAMVQIVGKGRTVSE